ncbi:hypothetical protein FB45DRAFT_880313 [Roridomyces roridus]|uniref:DUF6532 domain-containing protein n=1 Tax=Roridomyces roridus TaxID=1738132 RepID=A0AAD7AYQ0_9AGAR|nr:hypothetical protein FB45DRAFT_880313 [Roridomyces roridus]
MDTVRDKRFGAFWWVVFPTASTSISAIPARTTAARALSLPVSLPPRAGEKRPREQLPHLDLRVMQTRRLNTGGRVKAKDFDDTTQEALGLAIVIFRVFVAWVRDVWRAACERMNVSMELTPDLSKLITARDSHLRGEVKTKARPVVELSFKFASGESKTAIRRNRRIAERMREDMAFAFKNPAARKGIFRNIAIQKIINAVFFANRKDEGPNFPEYFDPLPLFVLALILTVIENCIDEWASGTRTDIPFTANEYREVYHRHVAALQEFDEVTKEYGILNTILQNLHDSGRAHSGAEPRTATSKGGLLSSDIDAALREFEEGELEEDEEDEDEEMDGDDEDEDDE